MDRTLKSICFSYFEKEIKYYLDEKEVQTRNSQVSFKSFQLKNL